MAVHSLKPTFNNRESYLAWRTSWKTIYRFIGADIRRRKLELKAESPDRSKMQKSLHLLRRDATKMLTLLKEAKLRRDRIIAMHDQIKNQNSTFPLRVDSRVIDFSFNRIHNEFAFMPRWLVRANGRTYYVEHFDAQIGFSTREMNDPKTKGMLRFRNASMTIDQTNTATITQRV